MAQECLSILRYPGGKQRLLEFILSNLPRTTDIKGSYVEPFVGGGAVFFGLNPERAVLADMNLELINLYRGISRYPLKVWSYYCKFPSSREQYYFIRDSEQPNADIAYRAARTLFLNRTCFKGMWRQNSKGKFNVGYGGQDRRWVINKEILLKVSERLKKASIFHSDFQKVIASSRNGDLLFLDPPYSPSEKESIREHYTFSKFVFNDYVRLATVLREANSRGVLWLMTTSAHPDIMALFEGCRVIALPQGTSRRPGITTTNPGEVLVSNYSEV